GFIHGHIKPANIMAVADQVKISSDTICALAEAGANAKTPGAYDAPEIASGRISTAADVWSLGMTLVEELTQHRPASDAAQSKDLSLPKELPEPYKNIVRDSLHIDPKSRATVEQVKSQLDMKPAIAGLPQSAVPRANWFQWVYLAPLAAAVIIFA